jgi:hypothetical protein
MLLQIFKKCKQRRSFETQDPKINHLVPEPERVGNLHNNYIRAAHTNLCHNVGPSENQFSSVYGLCDDTHTLRTHLLKHINTPSTHE